MKCFPDYVGKTARVLAYIGILAVTSCAHPVRYVGDPSLLLRGFEGREMRIIEPSQESNQKGSLEEKAFE